VGYTYWLWRELSLGHEQRRWFELALTFVDDASPHPVEARIRFGLGSYYSGGDSRRHSHNLRAIELLRRIGSEPLLLGHALLQASSSCPDVAESERYYDEALSLQRQCGRTKWLAYTLMNAGSVRNITGEWKAARALVEEALALSKVLRDDRVHDYCEARLAFIAFTAGQMTDAIDRARRAVEMSHRHGVLTIEFLALHSLAGFLILDDQMEDGRAAALRAFELSRALGNVGLSGSIYQLAFVHAGHGEAGTAARLAGFADSYPDHDQLSRYEIALAIRGKLVERLHGVMSSNECQAAMAEGAAWSEREAIAVALAA
jgi:tetratricopeptide (TPR) repeat protein